MVIDVSSILKETGGKVNIDGGLLLNDDNVIFDGEVKVKGVVYSNGQSLTLKAECEGTLKTQCARCLKDIDVNVSFPIEETLVHDDGTAVISDDEDIILFEGYSFEIDSIVLNSFLLYTSMKYLCKEDCRGLCSSCGSDLNEGECGCNHDFVDPRWSGLADMLNDNKE